MHTRWTLSHNLSSVYVCTEFINIISLFYSNYSTKENGPVNKKSKHISCDILVVLSRHALLSAHYHDPAGRLHTAPPPPLRHKAHHPNWPPMTLWPSILCFHCCAGALPLEPTEPTHPRLTSVHFSGSGEQSYASTILDKVHILYNNEV